MNLIFPTLSQRLSALKAIFTLYLLCVCRLSHHQYAAPCEVDRDHLSSSGGLTHMLAIAVERWVNRKTGRQTDGHADRRTDTTRLGCGYADHNTKIYLYFPKYGKDHNVFICKRDLVIGISYTGDIVTILDYQGTFLWSLCDTIMWILWRCVVNVLLSQLFYTAR